MSDKLKDFIDANREGLDSFEPGDLWANINSGISQGNSALTQTNSIVKGTKTMSWIKYGLSSLVVGAPLAYYVATADLDKKSAFTNTNSTNMNLADKNTRVVDEETKIVKETFMQEDSTKRKKKKEKQNQVVAASSTNSQPEDSVAVQPIQVTQNVQPTQPVQPSQPAVSKNSKPGNLKNKVQVNIDTVFSGVTRVLVKSGFCDVNIVQGRSEQLTLKGSISTEVKGVHSKLDNNYDVNYERKDSVLYVNVNCRRGNNIVMVGSMKSEAFLNIELPPSTQIQVEGNSGDVSMKGIKGKVLNIKTSFGDIKAENIEANLNLKSSSGDISLSEIKGSIFAESSFGDQRFESINGDVMSRSSSGDVVMKQVTGSLDVKSSFGDQTFDMVSGDMISTAGSGDVRLDNFKGNFNVRTSFGDIKGKNVEVKNKTVLETGSGDIDLDFTNDITKMSFDLLSNSGSLSVHDGKTERRSEKNMLLSNGDVMVKGITKFGSQHYK